MPGKKSKVESISDTIKIIGYILGGIWIVYLYLAHERESKILEADKDRLEIKKDSLDIVKSKQEYLKGQQDSILKSIELKYSEAFTTGQLTALQYQNSLNYVKRRKKIRNQMT